jgi:hypothetical protein
MVIAMNELMNRIKNLKEFTVTMEIPEDFSFRGVIPYDMTISKNIATITLVAVDEKEANEKVYEYFFK